LEKCRGRDGSSCASCARRKYDVDRRDVRSEHDDKTAASFSSQYTKCSRIIWNVRTTIIIINVSYRLRVIVFELWNSHRESALRRNTSKNSGAIVRRILSEYKWSLRTFGRILSTTAYGIKCWVLCNRRHRMIFCVNFVT